MKEILLIVLCAVLFLTGCAVDSGDGESDSSAETEESETLPIPGREDRDILDDYKNITSQGEHDVSVLYMNAGKADCTLLMVDGANYLIDTGTAASAPVIFASLERMEIDSLDGVFITHTDNDHVGGYTAVAERYPVSAVYTSTISSNWDKVDDIRGETERIALDPGAAVELADGVYFTVMGPVRYNSVEENNNSLVLRLEVNGVTALFAGDMMHDEETSLVYSELPLDCDILKVGYHGQKGASSLTFLEKATPSLAVISTDREEDDGSAHNSIVTALEGVGADVCVTDEYDLGLLVTIGHDGNVTTENLDSAHDAADLKFTTVSKEDQITVIENREGEDVDISGWYIVSIRGREVFSFPEGTVIGAGESITVACREYNGEYDFIWEENRVWHKDKKDLAVLYDTWGNRVDEEKSE